MLSDTLTRLCKSPTPPTSDEIFTLGRAINDAALTQFVYSLFPDAPPADAVSRPLCAILFAAARLHESPELQDRLNDEAFVVERLGALFDGSPTRWIVARRALRKFAANVREEIAAAAADAADADAAPAAKRGRRKQHDSRSDDALLERWARSKGYRSREQFCDDEGIEIASLCAAQNRVRYHRNSAK